MKNNPTTHHPSHTMNPESLTPGAFLWMMHNNKATPVLLLKVNTFHLWGEAKFYTFTVDTTVDSMRSPVDRLKLVDRDSTEVFEVEDASLLFSTKESLIASL